MLDKDILICAGLLRVRERGYTGYDRSEEARRALNIFLSKNGFLYLRQATAAGNPNSPGSAELRATRTQLYSSCSGVVEKSFNSIYLYST